jgi:hypothetical protein
MYTQNINHLKTLAEAELGWSFIGVETALGWNFLLILERMLQEDGIFVLILRKNAQLDWNFCVNIEGGGRARMEFYWSGSCTRMEFFINIGEETALRWNFCVNIEGGTALGWNFCVNIEERSCTIADF